MDHRRELLSLLADGRFHSGEALGQALGVSRANVWQVLKAMEPYGLAIEAVKGRGYRLPQPLDLLDPAKILSQLDSSALAVLAELELFLSINSTNGYLMQRGAQGLPSGAVCLTEHQAAGRGRRGRSWVSPLGRNIYLSVLWRFAEGPMRLGGLSLAIAIAVVEALQATGVEGLAIKWPNDIVTAQGKVGGILVEVAGESSGPCYAVVGIGLNVDMPVSAMASLEQPWANIARGQGQASRNELAAQLINHLFAALTLYPSAGLQPYLPRWHRYDHIAGKQINIHLHERVISGIARGIDPSGALLVEHDGRLASYTSGEVSVRVAEQP